MVSYIEALHLKYMCQIESELMWVLCFGLSKISLIIFFINVYVSHKNVHLKAIFCFALFCPSLCTYSFLSYLRASRIDHATWYGEVWSNSSSSSPLSSDQSNPEKEERRWASSSAPESFFFSRTEDIYFWLHHEIVMSK